jgi:DNA modification methylase
MNVIDQEVNERYALYNGDSCEVIKGIEDSSVGLSVFSPPFSSLYTYSDSDRDMGNSTNDDEFYKHFGYLVKELMRVTIPGRHVAIHCMNLPSTIQHNGHIGIRDFRGDLIRLFQHEGFIYHSEVCIWKDPVTAMQRTKAIGLLWKQIKKDSYISRQGLPDYIVVMRKPGNNPFPITHTPEEFPVKQWQEWASPVWMDINQSNTLQRESAREDKDERHICPLQLDVIKRLVVLWSNPGDIVLSPFMGIGSEGYESVKLRRKFIGIELKSSYYQQAVKNIKNASEIEGDLF